jgi:alkane 1-monooxygenase
VIKYLKYTNPVLFYFLALISFKNDGFWCWLTVIYAFVVVPSLEVLIKPDQTNMDIAEEEMAKDDRIYDYLLYVVVLLQLPMLFFFLFSFDTSGLTTIDVVGRILTMGILCGTFGINVGHELGHRKDKFEQLLAKISLLSSLYMHFFIEHNRGHHKNVATYKDPSSARYNEVIYLFYFRTIIRSYQSAWNIANNEVTKKGKSVFSLNNEMIQFHFVQAIFLMIIYLSFGAAITLYFFAAAFVGILLLETVNYIEHYGLQRKEIGGGKFERTMPYHSWNSNHILGRLMLFELSRHSDHHYLATRKYQILRHHPNSPQLPSGYPGSMLIALFPPLWFYIMNKKINKLY